MKNRIPFSKKKNRPGLFWGQPVGDYYGNRHGGCRAARYAPASGGQAAKSRAVADRPAAAASRGNWAIEGNAKTGTAVFVHWARVAASGEAGSIGSAEPPLGLPRVRVRVRVRVVRFRVRVRVVRVRVRVVMVRVVHTVLLAHEFS